MRIIRQLSVLISILVSAALVFSVSAQGGQELRLHLTRNFGYSSGTGKIQGTFTLRVAGPDDLITVEYFMDDQLLGKVNQEPFRLRFHTEDFNKGKHTLNAVGYTADGNEYSSNKVILEFISAEEGWRAGGNVLIIILGIVFCVGILSVLFTVIIPSKQKDLPPGTPRNYGLSGGTICPRCDRPYGRHFFAPNILVGKLDRCPYCSRWSIVRSMPLDILRAAETAELERKDGTPNQPSMNEAEKLQREIEDTRVQDY
jgi:hypothetical protein